MILPRPRHPVPRSRLTIPRHQLDSHMVIAPQSVAAAIHSLDLPCFQCHLTATLIHRGSQMTKSESARINGAKSHGPKTEAGRQRSSQNALKHGLTAQTLVLPTEDPDEFNQLLTSCLDQFQPDGPADSTWSTISLPPSGALSASPSSRPNSTSSTSNAPKNAPTTRSAPSSPSHPPSPGWLIPILTRSSSASRPVWSGPTRARSAT